VIPAEGRDYSPGWWPNVGGFRSQHANGLHFAMLDQSVQFVSDEIALDAYHALATIAGQETAALP